MFSLKSAVPIVASVWQHGES